MFGALFSLRCADFIRSGGYDEHFSGWGVEDTMVGAHAIALGNYILPSYSASGLHIAHGDRNANKREEFMINTRLLNFRLRLPFSAQEDNWTAWAKGCILASFRRHPSASVAHSHEEKSANYAKSVAAALETAAQQGSYLFSLGRYEEAAAAFRNTDARDEEKVWNHYRQASSLRRAGHIDAALPILADVAERLPTSALPKIEWALALAVADRFSEAQQLLWQAADLDPNNADLRFILGRPVDMHVERARLYALQGDTQFARWDYEAALAVDPDHKPALCERTALAT